MHNKTNSKSAPQRAERDRDNTCNWADGGGKGLLEMRERGSGDGGGKRE